MKESGFKGTSRRGDRILGLFRELFFWMRWLLLNKVRNPENFKRLLNPGLQISEFHRQFIDDLPEQRVRILEVGAGPMSNIGKRHPDKELELVPTDILANQYAKILSLFNVNPPFKTIYANVEKLEEKFEENSFDFVVANNAIDHCEDPVRAIVQMLFVVKPQHYVLLRHAEKEGERKNYSGIHWWNFGFDGNSPILFNKHYSVDISMIAEFWGTLKVFPEERHVVFAIHKEVENRPDCLQDEVAQLQR